MRVLALTVAIIFLCSLAGAFFLAMAAGLIFINSGGGLS